MNLRIRGAGSRDLYEVNRLLKIYNFPNFDVKHIEMLVVVEDLDTNAIIAIASLSTVLEAMFITDPTINKRKRVEALNIAIKTAKDAVTDLGYDSLQAMNVKNSKVSRTLKKSFNFKDMVGENLILFVR